MPQFWKVVNTVIAQSDVLLLLLDARLIEETRNPEVEDKVRRAGKPLIYVITKTDLVGKEEAERAKKLLRPCVFVSAKAFQGTTLLRERILIEGKRAYPDKERLWVGVLGYPNVGKSSLINAMKGRHSASTSSLSGHTRGVQAIKADNRVFFLDTPGVIPYKEKDEVKHAEIGTIDFTKAKQPDLVVLSLMERYPGRIGAHYGVEEGEDAEETLGAIAEKRRVLMKGGGPDIVRMARQILRDWQKGGIR